MEFFWRNRAGEGDTNRPHREDRICLLLWGQSRLQHVVFKKSTSSDDFRTHLRYSSRIRVFVLLNVVALKLSDTLSVKTYEVDMSPV